MRKLRVQEHGYVTNGDFWATTVWALRESSIKIDIMQVEAGMLKKNNYSISELEAEFMFEKNASLREIETEFRKGIIYKCML